ncbi:tRNA (N6-isopentenyl adenosine(37)-C2)-methylthiotransferase MiaB [Candidatus Bipolaricaulota bacterium]|nr:tRNA (N6-isopentenyl adenosine(37)-C2)-methylthiotransferase MiaB [Candidatus Bipolaricaulota bacterium]
MYIETWGCQMNLRQSEGMAGVLGSAGYRIVNSMEDADVVIFNGCMVRQLAEEKVFGRIGAVADEKRKRPVLLGVGGCMGQIHGQALIKRVESIDFVFGSSGHQALPALIEQARKQRIAELADQEFSPAIDVQRRSAVTGMVTITEGCSNFCTYCIVPYARGPMRSRPSDLILKEVEDLCEAGYKEVLLLGQNVNSYGTDQSIYGDFSELLKQVATTGIRRVRFTTSHPKDISETIFRTMKQEPNICHHLHLACQSGSDDVLRAMNRKYDRDHYVSMIEMGRGIMPDLNISTDLIVGFPGETDADFEATMALVERIRFGTVFVAKYSPRPLTRSAQMPDDVPIAVKEQRLERVLSRQRTIALEENGRFIGQDLEVLVEGVSRRGVMYGRADDHRTVMCHGDVALGEFVTVRIDAISVSALSGSILRRENLGGKT